MTTTTKVFVILVCLFAFIFTPMAIQFAARTNNWRKTAEGYRDEAETAYANERSAFAVAASEIEYYKDLLQAEHDTLLTARQTNNELQLQLDELRQDRDDLARSRDNWETSARLLTAEMTVKSEHNRTLTQAKEQALESERTLKTRNIELNDHIKELSADVVVRTQQLKQKLQEIEGYRTENEKLRKQLKLGQAADVPTVGPTPSAKAVGPVAVGPIAGEVTDVRGSLATINIGRNSGLQEGMTVVVTRGKAYVCDLEITSNITANEAVGRVTVQGDKRIQVQDLVVDLDSFESR